MSEEITETNTINNEQNNENNNNNNENNNSNNPQQGMIDAPISKEMKNCYLSYAMSVIVSRAIPDVRDGLKPVHRRILYAANDLGCAWNRQHKKSARIVGEVMGKYHPHGDSSIYDALVRLAQDFSMRVPLINGQGNFGSVDNDPPAAMRYTEARLAKVAHTMMQDLDKETVDFTPNFDGTEKEPVVLPAMFPNILVNGTEGIAVGMATNIPTHNLGELIDACLAYIDNPQITPQELVKIVPGPDFPTGGVILSRNLAMQAMLTGRGAIPVRGKSHVEELKGGREAIVITEIPYQVIKVDMIKKIADLVKEKKLEGISNIRDESNKNGIRIVIELKKDTSTDIVLNYLYKYTALQSSFAVNMLLLNKNRPELMNLHSIIKAFIDFRQEVVSRRTIFLLSQSRSRAHILIGFHVAVDNIDKVISIIRSSKDTQEAKTRLMAEQWEASDAVKQLIDLVQDKNNKVVDGKFSFTEAQVKAIIEMRLSRLTGIERENLANEIKELSLAIMDYLETLHNKAKLMGIISNELQAIKDEYATPRKTEIIDAEIGSTNIEDFIEKKDVLVSVSTGGYIKRTDLSNYTTQNRGGKGKIGMSTLEDDQVRQIFIANTHSPILFFTNNGKVYRIKAYQLPDVAPNAKGRSFVNFVKVEQGDTIAGLMPLPVDKNEWKQYDLIFATKKGNVRRSSIADFENINSNGKIAISLDEDDQLIRVLLAKKDDNIFLSTKNGMAICFKLDDLRIIKSRTSNGVRGIKLKDNDEVVSMCIIGSNEIEIEKRDMYLSLDAELRKNLKNAMNSETGIIDMELQSQLQDAIAKMDRTKFTLTTEEIKECAKKDQTLLTITSDGIGKRSSSLCYKVQNRGGSGLINIKLDNNQSVVTTLLANDDNEIIIIGNKGKTIRTLAKDIRETSRNTKGVKTINLENGEFVASASVVF